MKIKPKENYSMSGYGRLDKTKAYVAVPATNRPNWKENGLVFTLPNEDMKIELLLKANEYVVCDE
jgi:hypothetical protein